MTVESNDQPARAASSGGAERWRGAIGLAAGPIAAIAVLLAPFPDLSPPAHRLAAVFTLVIIFWLTEAIPIPVTALLGAALAVLLGVANAGPVLSAFGDPVIFLFLGSFMLARAMQVHGIDRRIAYALLAHPWVGVSTYRTLWALGLVTCLLSMWMSNTACVAMLFPVALALARASSELAGSDIGAGLVRSRYATGLLLMLAFSASVGGIATPVGTPPNLIGIALIEKGTGIRIGFVQWMFFGVPLALMLLGVVYGTIILLFRPEVRCVPGQLERMRAASRSLGSLSRGERNCIIAFGMAVFLWIAPGLVGLALGETHPVAQLLTHRLPEGIVALLAASLLFLLPTDWRRRQFTLRWEDAVRIDWGTILLFGGGIALGKLMFDTGLAEAVGRGVVSALGFESPALMTGLAVAVACILSETSSNTASANMAVPVMMSVARMGGASVLIVGIAATLGTSMGFMLPISTPPNAIVYSSRAVRLSDMVRAGLVLDLIGLIVIWMMCLWLVPMTVPSGGN
jgi:sodium-dependent dicarboxylate transporter 2/3/5